ncbi:MAG: pyridoxal phosphate-dependent aminotransferase [Candidatus Puniceispirillales bacterium]|nr:pyridoxal phosphate-dependent aminotransferase [Pseudomonadota bacterium]
MTDFVKADRLAKVKVSEIVVMSEAARQRRAEGHDVINLGIGEPDFDTPDHANDAAIAAINHHDTHYPPIAGKPELREAIAALYDGRGGTMRRPEHVLVSSGSKYTLLNAMLASVNPGDEVIMLAPFWTSYADIVRLCGGIPVIIPNDGARQFRPDLDQIAAAMTPRTRWIMINSPNNPSGAVLSADDLRGIGDLIKAHPQAMLLSDEIYEHIVYSEKFISVADALPDIADRILIVSGVSKSYAMTGWRLGYGIGSKELIAAMTAVQAQGTSGTTTISQAAALAAITGDQSILATQRDIFRQRRDLVCQHIKAMNGLTTEIPEGAFYVFASWQNCQGWKDVHGNILQSDMDFCQFILNEANVVVIPGSSFSMNGYFRISYASSTDELEEAMKRIAHAMTSLKPA